jgi:hypothetical protein
MKIPQVELSKLKHKIYLEAIRTGSVPGVVSYRVVDSGRGDDRFIVDRVYEFLGLQSRTPDCNYGDRSTAESEALNHCVDDLKGRPANLETRDSGEPLWPHTIECGKRNRSSMEVIVKKYVLGQIK